MSNISPPTQPPDPAKGDVYRDPIYGIPHFHDPAIMRIIQKHDPNYQINQSMKAIALKSQQRLRTVSVNKPRFLHRRFNIETLITSPLMCFPHFEDMTFFLMRWFKTKAQKEKELVTSNQKATFSAMSKFCDSLFLLLQETARAAPLSPKPLIGIYNWYLQRDTIIYQARTQTTQDQKSEYITIELTNGDVVEIKKAFLDVKQVLISNEEVKKIIVDSFCKEEPRKEVKETVVKKRSGSKQTRILRDPILTKPLPRSNETFMYSDDFDYPAFHKKLVAERQAEKDVDRIANEEKIRRRNEIKELPGFQ